MAASHKIQLTYDEETGKLSVVHRTVTAIGKQEVSHSEDVNLDNKKEIVGNLKELIDLNREEMETRADRMAIRHVAAIAGREEAGTKKVRLGGTVGPIGSSKAKKQPPTTEKE